MQGKSIFDNNLAIVARGWW